MAKTPEGEVKNRIKDALATLGPRCRAFWVVPSGMGENGISDVTCCIDGRFMSVEAKRGKVLEPTTLQKFRIADVRAAGGIAIVVNHQNVDQFEYLIEVVRTHPPGHLHIFKGMYGPGDTV